MNEDTGIATKLEALQAENARLKQALSEIEDAAWVMYDASGEGKGYEGIWKIANDALQEGQS